MDDNWLHGVAEVQIEQPPTATFRAKCDVAWQTTELLSFHESLRTLLDALTGTAMLTTIEDQVELTIQLENGKGTLVGRIEAHAIAALAFEVATDQTYLAETLSALKTSSRSTPIGVERAGWRPPRREVESQPSRALPRIADHRPDVAAILTRRLHWDSQTQEFPNRTLLRLSSFRALVSDRRRGFECSGAAISPLGRPAWRKPTAAAQALSSGVPVGLSAGDVEVKRGLRGPSARRRASG